MFLYIFKHPKAKVGGGVKTTLVTCMIYTNGVFTYHHTYIHTYIHIER
jgi:hypothetical protein